MRIIVRTEDMPVPIPILIPSVLLFNHVIAVIGLSVLWLLRCFGKKLPPPLTPWEAFVLYHRFVLQYWKCRFLHPGWKLVCVRTKDARVSVKL